MGSFSSGRSIGLTGHHVLLVYSLGIRPEEGGLQKGEDQLLIAFVPATRTTCRGGVIPAAGGGGAGGSFSQQDYRQPVTKRNLLSRGFSGVL